MVKVLQFEIADDVQAALVSGEFMKFNFDKTLFTLISVSVNLLSSQTLACGAPRKEKITPKLKLELSQSPDQLNMTMMTVQGEQVSAIGRQRQELIALKDSVVRKRAVKARLESATSNL